MSNNAIIIVLYYIRIMSSADTPQFIPADADKPPKGGISVDDIRQRALAGDERAAFILAAREKSAAVRATDKSVSAEEPNVVEPTTQPKEVDNRVRRDGFYDFLQNGNVDFAEHQLEPEIGIRKFVSVEELKSVLLREYPYFTGKNDDTKAKPKAFDIFVYAYIGDKKQRIRLGTKMYKGAWGTSLDLEVVRIQAPPPEKL